MQGGDLRVLRFQGLVGMIQHVVVLVQSLTTSIAWIPGYAMKLYWEHAKCRG